MTLPPTAPVSSAPRQFMVFAPSIRVARDVLRVDLGIHPQCPAIHIVTSERGLSSLSWGSPVRLIDPLFSLTGEQKAVVQLLAATGRIRDWTDDETRGLRRDFPA